MSAVRLVESSAGIQAVVDRRAMALAWPCGDGSWLVQHRGEPDPVMAEDRDSAEAHLRGMFAAALP